MKKKTIGIALVISLCLVSFIGCSTITPNPTAVPGATEDTPVTAVPTDVPPTVTPTDTPTPEPTSPPADQCLTYYQGDDGIHITAYTASAYHVTVPETIDGIQVVAIDNAIFQGTDVRQVTIEAQLTSLNANLFKNCRDLKKVILPDTVVEIGDHCFCNCTSLKGIRLPQDLTALSDYAFDGCTSLSSVSIPGTVDTIGAHAFEWCAALNSVVLCDGTRVIGDHAFSSCSALSSLDLPSSVTTLEDYAFNGCLMLKKVVLPASITTLGKYVFSCCGVDEAIIECDTINDTLFYECDNLTAYYGHIYYKGVDYYTQEWNYVFLYLSGCYELSDLTPDQQRHITGVLNIMKEMDIDENDSVETKVQKIHDWLVINVSYSEGLLTKAEESGEDGICACIYDRIAICWSYAFTFKLCMDVLNVPCLLIYSSEMSHDWNMVYMPDGHWYHIDVTWDDPGYSDTEWLPGYYRTLFFLRNDEGITENSHYNWYAVRDISTADSEHTNYTTADTPLGDGTYYENSVFHDILYPVNSNE